MENLGMPKKDLDHRYADIDKAGRQTFEKVEDFPYFEDFPEELEPLVTAWLEFAPGSLDEIKQRILDKLETIEKETGMSLYLAGRDFLMHSTLLQGKGAELSQSEIGEKFTELSTDTTVQSGASEVVHTHIPYQHLLLDKKGNLILVSTEIPETIPRARAVFAKQYEQMGLVPATIPILHSTVARVKTLPTEQPEAALSQLTEAVKKLRYDLWAEPVDVEISAVRVNHGFVSQAGPSAPLAQ